MEQFRKILIDWDGWTINGKTLTEYTVEELQRLQNRLRVVRIGVLSSIACKKTLKVKLG